MAEAREAGVHLIAAGHYATETLGVTRLGEHLAEPVRTSPRVPRRTEPGVIDPRAKIVRQALRSGAQIRALIKEEY